MERLRTLIEDLTSAAVIIGFITLVLVIASAHA